jgi:hypothetical protein
MSGDTAIVWWIEADTGELKSQSMGPHDLRRGTNFQYEVGTKYARYPIEMLTIDNQSAGNAWAKDSLERLRGLSQQIRENIAIQQGNKSPE